LNAEENERWLKRETIRITSSRRSLGDILKIRREKLAALREGRNDPFEQTRFDWDTTSAQHQGEF
jgi:hypothetical protein